MTIHLDIVSAERQIFSGPVESLMASGDLGDLGIFPGHAPLLTALRPGEIEAVLSGGERQVFYISGGILEVQPNAVTVLADAADRADNLDEALALAAKSKALEAMASKDSDIDYTVASAELARAVAQIRVIKKMRKEYT